MVVNTVKVWHGAETFCVGSAMVVECRNGIVECSLIDCRKGIINCSDVRV